MTAIGFIDEDYMVYDGANTATNCTPVNKQQYSYNAGIFLPGAATMYNYVSLQIHTLWVQQKGW
jgi:mannan endo-1,6-alpha-mannosidase